MGEGLLVFVEFGEGRVGGSLEGGCGLEILLIGGRLVVVAIVMLAFVGAVVVPVLRLGVVTTVLVASEFMSNI